MASQGGFLPPSPSSLLFSCQVAYSADLSCWGIMEGMLNARALGVLSSFRDGPSKPVPSGLVCPLGANGYAAKKMDFHGYSVDFVRSSSTHLGRDWTSEIDDVHANVFGAPLGSQVFEGDLEANLATQALPPASPLCFL